MNGTEVLLTIAGAVALLLWGTRMVRTGVLRAFGVALRSILAAWTGNRLQMAGGGFAVGAALQSGTASTLLTCSFVGRGALALSAGLAVVLGAEAGSAFAALLLNSGIATVWPLFAFAGFALFAVFDGRDTRLKHIGRILMGFATLLLALNILGQAAHEVAAHPLVVSVVQAVSTAPVMAVLVGALLTWALHSSIAMVLLAASIAATGAVEPAALYFFVLGVNLGSAMPVLTGSLAEPRSARRVAVANVLFRLIGVTLGAIVLAMAAPKIGALPWPPGYGVTGFHLAYNVLQCLALLPLAPAMARLVERMLPDLPENGEEAISQRLDESLMHAPSVAIGLAVRETLRMGDIVESMLARTKRVLLADDDDLRREVQASDDRIDDLHEAIKLFLTRLSTAEMDDTESRRCVDIIAFTTNLEHVGDIVDKNLMETAQKKSRRKLSFSREGQRELADMHARIMDTLQIALAVFMNQDVEAARSLIARKDQFRMLELAGTERHLERLRSGRPESIETSSIHLDILRDFKRINSHLTAVAYPILDRAGELRSSRLKGAQVTIEPPAPLPEGGLAAVTPRRGTSSRS